MHARPLNLISFKSMSGAAISSTMERSQVSPPKFVEPTANNGLVSIFIRHRFSFRPNGRLFVSFGNYIVQRLLTSYPQNAQSKLRFLTSNFFFGERASFALMSDVLLRRGDFNGK